MKVDYGAVALIPKGEFDATKQYAVNDLVSYNGSSFIVKAVPPIGTLPTNTAYFTVNASGTSPATPSTAGTVKPDNSTIEVDNSGVISVKPEVLDRVSSSEQALTVNLLNPTLASGTLTGITFARNADNSYTLNGTATKDTYLIVAREFTTTKSQKVRITGCPQGGTESTFYAAVQISNGTATVRDLGYGATRQLSAGESYNFLIVIKSDAVCDNLVFKPMLTANLSATYDDYVPYSGSSGKLDTDFKTLSEKIGNVGNTDLQSQLNAANQSIAQNTTDIAANAAGISALNTGLTTKIGTYETQQDNRILSIVHNINSDEILAYDEKLATWFPLWSKPKIAGLNFFTPASNVEITYQAIFMCGKMRIVQLNLRLLTQFADGALIATSSATAPLNASYCTCRDGLNHLATFSFNPDRRLICWGANPANTDNIYPIQLTYFVA